MIAPSHVYVRRVPACLRACLKHHLPPQAPLPPSAAAMPARSIYGTIKHPHPVLDSTPQNLFPTSCRAQCQQSSHPLTDRPTDRLTVTVPHDTIFFPLMNLDGLPPRLLPTHACIHSRVEGKRSPRVAVTAHVFPRLSAILCLAYSGPRRSPVQPRCAPTHGARLSAYRGQRTAIRQIVASSNASIVAVRSPVKTLWSGHQQI